MIVFVLFPNYICKCGLSVYLKFYCTSVLNSVLSYCLMILFFLFLTIFQNSWSGHGVPCYCSYIGKCLNKVTKFYIAWDVYGTTCHPSLFLAVRCPSSFTYSIYFIFSLLLSFISCLCTFFTRQFMDNTYSFSSKLAPVLKVNETSYKYLLWEKAVCDKCGKSAGRS